LTIKPDARVHNCVTFRNEAANVIQVNIAGNNYADYNYIAIIADASTEYDYDYDAAKLPGLSEAPQLYTLKQEVQLSANAVQTEEDILGMVLYLEVGVAAEYELTYTHTLMGDNILILDKLTSQIIRKGQTYRFAATPTDRTDRFEFVDESSILSAGYQETLSIIPVWEDNNMLYIGNLGDETLTTISIYNTLGAQVMSSSSQVTDLNMLSRGVYSVKVYTDKRTINHKLIVK
jgi:hypothetical protein